MKTTKQKSHQTARMVIWLLLTMGNYTLSASSENPGEKTDLKSEKILLTCSPVWEEDFSFSDGTTSDNGPTSWVTSNNGGGSFQVSGGEFMASNMGAGNQAQWTSERFDISNMPDITISVDMRSVGDMESSGSSVDYLRLYYSLDGASPVRAKQFLGAINENSSTPTTVTTDKLNGSTLRIYITARTTASGEQYYFDNIVVKSNLKATGSVSEKINCTNTSVTLSGGSNKSGVTYSWSGPDGFSSSLQNPDVSAPGSYTLTVNDSGTGCNASTMVDVMGGFTGTFWFEDFTLSDGTTSDNGQTAWSTTNNGGGNFKVSEGEFMISNTGAGVQGVWTSGLIDISDKPDVTISVGMRSEVINGGNGLESSGDLRDYLRLYYSLNGGTAVLAHEFLGGINGNSSEATMITTNKLNGSTLRVYIAGSTTASDELYYFDGVEISSQISASASVSGDLSCTNSSVTIYGSSNSSSVSYKWTGPEGFTTMDQNPVVINPGTYTLTVKDLETGCMSASSTEVVESNTANIWNEDFSVADGSTSDNGTTSWSTDNNGGGNFEVSGGEFKAVNIGAGNRGLWTSQTLNISGKPDVTISVAMRSEELIEGNGLENSGDLIDYIRLYYSLDGGSAILAHEFLGEINGNSSTPTIVSTDKLNGSTLKVYITARTTGVDELYYFDDVSINSTFAASVSTNGTLDCSVGSVTLNGSTNSSSATFSWDGPDGFSSSSQNPSVSSPGTYHLTATSPAGCIAEGTVDIGFNPSLTIWDEAFNLANGTTSDGGPTGWTTDNSGGGTFEVSGGEFKVVNIGSGKRGLWVSDVLDISGMPDVMISAAMRSEVIGDAQMDESGDSKDFLQFYYRVNGGSEILVKEFVAGINGHSSVPTVVTSEKINGSTLQVFMVGRTTASDEIYYFDDVTVSSNISASAVVNGELTKTNTSVVIEGKSNAPGAVYSWEGPDGFSSSAQNPIVTAPGTYIVTAGLPNGTCTATESVEVIFNKFSPFWHEDFSLSDDATIDEGTTAWSTENTGAGNFSVLNNEFEVTAIGHGEKGIWTSEEIDISGMSNVKISVDLRSMVAGTQIMNNSGSNLDYARIYYKLDGGSKVLFHESLGTINGHNTTPTNFSIEGLNGSTLQVVIKARTTVTDEFYYIDNVIVAAEFVTTSLDLSASASGELTCTNDEVTLTANSTSSTAVFTWTGFGEGVNPVTVTEAGDYTVTAEDTQTGQTQTLTLTVVGNTTAPNLSATVGGVITCANPEVTLTANSTTTNAVITWDGDGFSPGQSTVTVTGPGDFTVTATDPSNGCVTEQTVTVEADVTAPNLTTSADGVITCNNPEVILTALSTTSNVMFTWNGSAEGLNPITVSTPDDYTVTVVSVQNGCSTQKTVQVEANITSPDLTTSADGTITCDNPDVELTASSSTADVSFTWTGFPEGLNPISVSVPGEYTATATDLQNGCTTQQMVIVEADITSPDLTASADGVISCNNPDVVLTAASGIEGVLFTWTGFPEGVNPVTVTSEDSYTVTATDPQNGCSSQQTVEVTSTTGEISVEASASGILTCTATPVTLTSTTNAASPQFMWTGPDDFTSASSNPEVTEAGTYTVEVTDLSNNCTGSASIEVEADTDAPDLSISSDFTEIACKSPVVTLTAASGTPNVTFTWAGHAEGQNQISVSSPDNYTVTALNSQNGCTTEETITIDANISSPNLSTSIEGAISCSNSSATLTAASTTPNVTFTWDGFSEGQNPVVVTSGGNYKVTATDSDNGCTSQATVTVTEEGTLSGLIVSTSGIINCENNEVTLSASIEGTDISGYEYQWTYPDNSSSTEANPSVSSIGVYTLTLTDPNTGCTATGPVEVTESFVVPDSEASVTGGILTCSNTYVVLRGSSSSTNVSYLWSGPNGFTSNSKDKLAFNGGLYTLRVTDLTSLCFSEKQVTVEANKTSPPVSATADGVITCTNTEVTLTASSSLTGVTFAWDGFDAGINPVTVSESGNQKVIATNPNNGCTTSLTVAVGLNDTPPLCGFNLTDNSSVTAGSSNTISTTNSANYSFAWTVTSADEGWAISAGQGTKTLTFLAGTEGTSATIEVEVTDNTNGCVSNCAITLNATSASTRMTSLTNSITEWEYKAYPNPSKGRVAISFRSPEDEDVVVELYDLTGSLVSVIFSGQIESGKNNTLVFNEHSNLPNGIYYYLIRTNSKIIRDRIMISR